MWDLAFGQPSHMRKWLHGIKKLYMDVFGQYTIGKYFSSSAYNKNKIKIK
jgi:hypothetical protein